MTKARLLLCVLVLATITTTTTIAEARPNVLLIISSGNGLQFGCYGDGTVPTPNVDALAASGTRFTQAFVTQAVCSSSRASIYTGLYPHQHGQIGLATHQFTMVGNPPTLPKLLREAGYRTGLIGKLNVLPDSAFPYDFRFDDQDVVSFEHRDVKRTAEEAGKFIAADVRPFCLTVCFPDAHLPFLPQDGGLPVKPIRAGDVRTPTAVGVDTPRLREQAADYYNCISRLDTGIGHLLQELERSGRAANTLVIYVSDHGPQFGRGAMTCYEFGLRVPLIVRDPRLKRLGEVRDEFVSTVDILPTILEATGAAEPKNLAGKSLAPLMESSDPDWRKFLFAEWNGSHAWPAPSLTFPQRSVRDGRFKLIRNLTAETPNPAEEYYTTQILAATGATQAEINSASEQVRAGYAVWRAAPAVELYDLFHDRYELENIADQPEFADVRQRLMNALANWRTETNDPLIEPQNLRLLLDEDRLQTLRAQTTGETGNHPWQYPEYLYGAAPPSPPKP